MVSCSDVTTDDAIPLPDTSGEGEHDGELIGEFVVPSDELPEVGRHQDAVLCVRVEDDRLTNARYDPDQTEVCRESAQERFDGLAERLENYRE